MREIMKKNVEVWILRFGCFLLMVITSALLNPNTAYPQSGKILDNIFTFELKFGAENLPNEYLLAKPTDCIAADNGDIIVADEYKLKIFDNNGNPKKILGGYGQGPGEFAYSSISIDLTFPKNSMLAGLQSNIYNLYTPDYSFIEKKNLQQSSYKDEIQNKFNLTNVFFYMVCCYSKNELLLFARGSRTAVGDNKRLDILLHCNGADMKIVMADSFEVSSNYDNVMGRHFTKIMPDYRWLYTNTLIQKYEKKKEWHYSLFIYDIKTLKRMEITHSYSLVVIPDSVINRKIPPEIAELPEPYKTSFLNSEKKRKDELITLKYCAPLQELLADGNFIFAITYTYEKGKGYLVDVFDAETGAYLKSVYFSFIPKQILNGYAYKLVVGGDVYPEVLKYKVNPAVYGK
jgi:hypothetical protein